MLTCPNHDEARHAEVSRGFVEPADRHPDLETLRLNGSEQFPHGTLQPEIPYLFYTIAEFTKTRH
jgi:hypothetical protein